MISRYESLRLPIPRENKPNQPQSQPPHPVPSKTTTAQPSRAPFTLHEPRFTRLPLATAPHHTHDDIESRPTTVPPTCKICPPRLQIPTHNFLCSSPFAHFSCLLGFATSYNMLPLQPLQSPHFNEPVATDPRPKEVAFFTRLPNLFTRFPQCLAHFSKKSLTFCIFHLLFTYPNHPATNLHNAKPKFQLPTQQGVYYRAKCQKSELAPPNRKNLPANLTISKKFRIFGRQNYLQKLVAAV